MCARVCVCAEKPEPLLEFGHDLAVTHRERERGQQQQQPRLCKTSGSLTSLCRRLEAGLLAVCHGVHRGRVYCTDQARCHVEPFVNPALLQLTVNTRMKVKTEMTARVVPMVPVALFDDVSLISEENAKKLFSQNISLEDFQVEQISC